LGFSSGWPFLLFDGGNYDFAAVREFCLGAGGLVGVLIFVSQLANHAVAFFGDEGVLLIGQFKSEVQRCYTGIEKNTS
jgi:hypothetical protein